MLFFLVINILNIEMQVHDYKKDIKLTHQYILNDKIDKEYLDSVVSVYDDFNMQIVKDTKMDLYDYKPSGKYKQFIDNCYSKLDNRVEEIKNDGESTQLTYPGQVYRLHNILYYNVFKKLMLEMAVIISVCTLFLMDYERINNTTGIVFVTKRGRTIQKSKMVSAMLVGSAINSILMIGTLGYYFTNIQYKGLWKVSLSSAMAMETRGLLTYPFITYIKMSFGKYLMFSVGYAIVLILLVSVLSSAIQLVTNNSYISIIIVVITMLGLLNILQFSTNTWLDLLLSFNLASSWNDCGSWFMENHLFTSFKAYDWISILVQTCIVSILFSVAYKRFCRKDYV